MLGKEDFLVSQALGRRGVSVCDIARQLGVHPKTGSRALARGSAPTATRRKRKSVLDPDRGQVDQLLAEGVWHARVMFRGLQARGYTGTRSIWRDDIRPKRALRPGRVTVRFETEPRRQLQSDWREIRSVVGGVETDGPFCVNTLGSSRRFHVWGTDRADAEPTDEGLIRSFEWCGGVSAEVLVDNQKGAVLEHRADGPRFNARLLDLAGHYGFTPRACQPARARTKGQDERLGGSITHHVFVRYRAFDRWVHLHQLAEQWLRAEADQRKHGTVQEIVVERFAREQPPRQRLPVTRDDTSSWELRQVSWDAYIEVRGNRDSVPAALAGRRLSVRIALDSTFAGYDGEQKGADHRLRPASEGWVTVPEHHRAMGEALQVERRPLAIDEEVGHWNCPPSSSG